MADFELRLKTVEILGWLSSAASADEQQKKAGNFLNGMGIEYNRFGTTLVAATADPEPGKKNVCLRAYYPPVFETACRPVFRDGAIGGSNLAASLEIAIRLAAFSRTKELELPFNLFFILSEEDAALPALYRWDAEADPYSPARLPERLGAEGIALREDGGRPFAALSAIDGYLDRTSLRLIAFGAG